MESNRKRRMRLPLPPRSSPHQQHPRRRPRLQDHGRKTRGTGRIGTRFRQEEARTPVLVMSEASRLRLLIRIRPRDLISASSPKHQRFPPEPRRSALTVHPNLRGSGKASRQSQPFPSHPPRPPRPLPAAKRIPMSIPMDSSTQRPRARNTQQEKKQESHSRIPDSRPETITKPKKRQGRPTIPRSKRTMPRKVCLLWAERSLLHRQPPPRPLPAHPRQRREPRQQQRNNPPLATKVQCGDRRKPPPERP